MKPEFSRAVFLDRDGVINEETDHVKSVHDLKMIPHTAEAVRDMHAKGYRVIVVTNQGAVAKGLTTLRDVHEVHDAVQAELAKAGAKIDAFYFCPHHPQGSVKEYAVACDCRKPKTGMLARAASDWNIDLAKSFLVGDKTSDILAGKQAGVATILVKTGYAGRDGQHDVTPDFIADDLMAATKYIS